MESATPPPYIPPRHEVFRCRTDRRMYFLPVVFWCLFDAVVLIGAPDILWGIFGVCFSTAPFVFVILLSHWMWSGITYTVDGRTLRVYAPLKQVSIDIGEIRKIRRGRFWVERGRNYSASYVKLRIIYGRSSYIYVSPENEEAFVDVLRSVNPGISFSSERGLDSRPGEVKKTGKKCGRS